MSICAGGSSNAGIGNPPPQPNFSFSTTTIANPPKQDTGATQQKTGFGAFAAVSSQPLQLQQGLPTSTLGNAAANKTAISFGGDTSKTAPSFNFSSGNSNAGGATSEFSFSSRPTVTMALTPNSNSSNNNTSDIAGKASSAKFDSTTPVVATQSLEGTEFGKMLAGFDKLQKKSGETDAVPKLQTGVKLINAPQQNKTAISTGIFCQ